jgi:hypothetical protein
MQFKDNLMAESIDSIPLSFASMTYVYQIAIPQLFTTQASNAYRRETSSKIDDIESFFKSYIEEWEALSLLAAGVDIAVVIQSNQEIDEVMFKLVTSCTFTVVSSNWYNQKVKEYNQGIFKCSK